ncbi:MAG TPA: hypothetical protein VH414_22205 [Lichenihabitans sp.]|jgi:hypothetical protein|nr:hypothetical protein [Lichenihabitans sp.]
MSHDPPPEGTNPNTRPSTEQAEAEIAEAKRQDKMKSVCHSHRVAGTAPPPGKVAKVDPVMPLGRSS